MYNFAGTPSTFFKNLIMNFIKLFTFYFEKKLKKKTWILLNVQEYLKLYVVVSVIVAIMAGQIRFQMEFAIGY